MKPQSIVGSSLFPPAISPHLLHISLKNLNIYSLFSVFILIQASILYKFSSFTSPRSLSKSQNP